MRASTRKWINRGRHHAQLKAKGRKTEAEKYRANFHRQDKFERGMAAAS